MLHVYHWTQIQLSRSMTACHANKQEKKNETTFNTQIKRVNVTLLQILEANRKALYTLHASQSLIARCSSR